MQPILLIDANNLMYAAQHGSRKLVAGDQDVTAIWGMLGSLRNIMLRFPNAKPIVLWDSSPTWRHEFYPDYKGNRKENPALMAVTMALRPQRPILKDLLDNLGVRQFTVDKMEADDLAADLSRKYAKQGGKVIMVTRDGDWQQLVQPGVIWYDHKNDAIIDIDNFTEKTGFATPAKFMRGKAIEGDVGDNVAGVTGLGAGAAKLVMSEFDCLIDLCAVWDDFRETIVKGHPWSRYKKMLDRVFANPDWLTEYRHALRLVDLVNFDYPKMEYRYDGVYNENAVKQIFGSLGFHSLLRKYDAWIEPILKGVVK